MTPPNIPIDRAIALATKLVVNNAQHQDYKRVVKLAKTYKMLITGEDMGELYKRYNRRESEADMKQAMEITNPLTPSICNALTNPLRKLANVSAKINIIEYEGDPDKKKAKALATIIDGFNGGNDIDSLFADSFIDYGVQDPNAFVLYTFENYDNRYEKADVFATVQPSADVWNFEYHSNVLQWLFLHKTIQYQTAPAPSGGVPNFIDGNKFIYYTPEHHIVFTQVYRTNVNPYTVNTVVDVDNVAVTNPAISTGDVTYTYFLNTSDALYEVTFYAQKSGRVPAFRLGFKRDPLTNGRTMVNLWHAAMPYLLKNVKSVRELDISFVLHTFPVRLSYVSPCNAPGCNGGYMAEGGLCGTCKGTNKQQVTSGQDGIEIALPDRPIPDLLIDLKKLMTYVDFPTDIVKLQMENVKDQIAGAFKAVYNSDVFVTDTTAETATGQKIDMQSVYDTLQPASLWYSSARMESVYIIATYKDLDNGLIVIHRFPRDFHFESQDQLIDRMNRARGLVPTGLMTYYQNSLVDIALVDDPFQAERVKTATRIDPYAGKTGEEIVFIMSQPITTRRNKVLHANLEYILDIAEASTTDDAVFYSLARKKQDEIVNKIVADMIVEIDESAAQLAPALSLGAEPDQTDETRSGEDTSQDDGQGTTDPVPPVGEGA